MRLFAWTGGRGSRDENSAGTIGKRKYVRTFSRGERLTVCAPSLGMRGSDGGIFSAGRTSFQPPSGCSEKKEKEGKEKGKKKGKNDPKNSSGA